MAEAPDAIVVFTNFPDRDSALALASHLIEQRLAACVNVLEGCTSVYRWKSEVQVAGEFPVMIKTRQELYADLQAAIRDHHPYELPEIIALPVTAGMPGYLAWIAAQTER
ncbi:MAG TPA: divalent-cation tolerance protein CutA [Burkholderiales bacterium]|jgi:periplasmic divalent cation tolerance protein|nr:divalent-cation tolerance protein CutA [Burkholderiales bacterium]